MEYLYHLNVSFVNDLPKGKSIAEPRLHKVVSASRGDPYSQGDWT